MKTAMALRHDQRLCFIWAGAFFLILFFTLMVGFVRPVYSAKAPEIKTAVWKKGKSILKLSGKNWGANQVLTITDAFSRDILKTVETDKKGRWKSTIANPDSVPCRVRAASDTDFVEKDVLKAPGNCIGLSGMRVFAFNDLGMHCYDSDFSVFSTLPLFNVLNAQVVLPGNNGNNARILNNSEVDVYYSGIADENGSINTTSIGKTNFWDYASLLFGANLSPDQGILGADMPGQANNPKAFQEYNTDTGWFSARGIPITSWDDNLQWNPYPLMSVQAANAGQTGMSPATHAVAPASDEMNCSVCHLTNNEAANGATASKYGISGWSANSNPDLQYRENILILHDGINATDLNNSQPVLCASCHYSPALDLEGIGGPSGNQIGKPMLSFAVHNRHGRTVAGELPGPSPAIIPDGGTASCYLCHPGSETQCLRGAMGDAGINCQDCHGGMLSVGGEYDLVGNGKRTPWLNEPKCQSCHTGDAVSHSGSSIRLNMAYDPSDPAATPTVAVNQRFAEENNKLYRNSLGHGGMACEACHGSTHAEWPVSDPLANDNIAAVQLQGHSGPIIECKVCHTDGLPLTTNGPHGLHNINDGSWNEEHEEFYEQNADSCKACHGLDLLGTVLSRAANNRTLSTEEGQVSVVKGARIGCSLCHENPLSE